MVSNGNNRDVDIDLARLATAVWAKKTRVALITLLAGTTALIASSMVSPRYKGEARLLIETRSANFSTGQAGSTGDEALLDALNISSQAQILQSVDLIKVVADELRLYELPEFDANAKPSVLSHLMIGLGLKADPTSRLPSERILQAFREKLLVYQVENSRVIAVEFSSQDPKLAAIVPNALLKAYIDTQSSAKLDTNSEAAKWLEPEIETLRERVREADRKVADFRNSADLLSVGEGNSFANRQLSDISGEIARLRAEKATAEARAENVREAIAAGRSLDSITDVVGSAMIQRLKENEANIQAQISDLSTSLLEGHPRIRALRAQLAGLRSQISEESRRVLATLENEANVARLRETELTKQLSELKANSARAGEQEVDLNELEREAAAQRQLLETYLARYREATSRAGSQDSTPADARIISQAVEPRDAYFPKTGANVIVAMLAALILSALFIMLSELFSGRALRPVGGANPPAPEDDEVAQAPARTPVTLPHASTSTRDQDLSAAPAYVRQDEELGFKHERELEQQIAAQEVAAAEPKKADNLDVEAAQLPTNITSSDDVGFGEFSIEAVSEFLSMRGAKGVVLVLSPTGADGSAQTVELARKLADGGRPTILLDMTVNGAPSNLMAARPNLPGIMDLLIGDAAFGEAIHGDRGSAAHIVPQGVVQPTGPVKVYDRLAMVVGALSDAYETVLIECGQARVESVLRMLSHLPAEVILSVPDGDAELIDALLEAFRSNGQGDVMPMTSIAL